MHHEFFEVDVFATGAFNGNALAVIAGADEAARGVVQVKDLILGAKIAAQASVEEWKSQPAQVEVPRADLVETVRGILAR